MPAASNRKNVYAVAAPATTVSLASYARADALVGLTREAQLEGVGGGEEVRQQGEAGRQVEHEVQRVVDEQREPQQCLDAERGDDQGGDRGAVVVLPSEELREVVGPRRDVHDLGRHQRPGQVGAQHRDDHGHADEHLAPVADDRLEEADHRGLPGRRRSPAAASPSSWTA